MKEPFSFEPGRVVESIQGRDKGGFFLVLENAGDGIVMIADGARHKLGHPKKKKTAAEPEDASAGRRSTAGQRPETGAGNKRFRGRTLAAKGGLGFCPRAM